MNIIIILSIAYRLSVLLHSTKEVRSSIFIVVAVHHSIPQSKEDQIQNVFGGIITYWAPVDCRRYYTPYLYLPHTSGMAHFFLVLSTYKYLPT